MIVRPLASHELPVYDELAGRLGPLFCDRAWLALFAGRAQPLGIFDEGGVMVGGLALYRERRAGLTVLRQAPYSPTSGPFLDVKARDLVAVAENWRRALEAMAAYLDGQRPALTMLSLAPTVVDTLPFYWRGYKVVPRYTYRIDLTRPLDAIRADLSNERRRNLSKGLRDGLGVQATTDMNIVRDLVLATFARQEMRIAQKPLEAVLFQYARATNSYAYTTYRGDEPIATSFVVHDARTAYYLLGGYRSENRHHGAGPMAMQAAIERAHALGLQVFDFEGSMIPAIEKYFRGFGGRLTPFYTVNKAWLPLEMALKFVKRTAF